MPIGLDQKLKLDGGNAAVIILSPISFGCGKQRFFSATQLSAHSLVGNRRCDVCQVK